MLVIVMGLSACAHHDLKPPCRYPAAAVVVGDCGPLRPIQ
jgi:hypothetical protein